MVNRAPIMVLTALAVMGAACVRAQTLQAVGPALAVAAAIAAPTSIDDILEQTTDVEPDEAPPPPPADVGMTSDQLDNRIRGASAAAQSRQGPMDGTWSLQGENGEPLYTFLLVDSARPPATLEGAWRDLKRDEGLSGTGLIADIRRTDTLLQASFYPKGGQETAALNLIQGGDGDWAGQLVQGGVTRPVRLIRSEPLLDVAPLRVAGSGVVSPYRTPASNTRVAPARKKIVKKKTARKKAAAKTASARKTKNKKKKG